MPVPAGVAQSSDESIRPPVGAINLLPRILLQHSGFAVPQSGSPRPRGTEVWSSHSPLIAELACEAVQVVDVLLGPHDHLEGWD